MEIGRAIEARFRRRTARNDAPIVGNDLIKTENNRSERWEAEERFKDGHLFAEDVKQRVFAVQSFARFGVKKRDFMPCAVAVNLV